MGGCGGDSDSDAGDEDMDEDEDEEVFEEAAESMSENGRNRADSLTQGRSSPSPRAHQALRAPVNLDAGGAAR